MIKYILIIVVLLLFTSVLFMSTSESDSDELITTVDISLAISPEKSDTAEISNKNKDGVPIEIISKCPSVGEVVFSHLEHSEDFEIECVECHHEMEAKNITIPHEEYFDESWINCKSCHDKPDTEEMVAHACSTCHNSHPVNIADKMISKKVAIHKKCWECHDSGTSVEASESCVTCHVK